MLQSPQSQIIKYISVVLLFLSIKTSLCAQNKTFIKFIHHSISIDDFEFGNNIQIKDKNYLFLKICNTDSILDCFIFKKNRLFSFGKLKIVTNKSRKIAIRFGYWMYTSQKIYEKIYFVNDEEFKEKKLINEQTFL